MRFHVTKRVNLFAACLLVGCRLCAGMAFTDFTVSGLEKPVHYFAPYDVNSGDACQTVLVIVHGWGDGVELPAESSSFVAAAESRFGKASVPYVIAPRLPDAQDDDQVQVEGRRPGPLV